MSDAIILDNEGNELPASTESLDQLLTALDDQFPEDAPHIVLES